MLTYRTDFLRSIKPSFQPKNEISHEKGSVLPVPYQLKVL